MLDIRDIPDKLRYVHHVRKIYSICRVYDKPEKAMHNKMTCTRCGTIYDNMNEHIGYEVASGNCGQSEHDSTERTLGRGGLCTNIMSSQQSEHYGTNRVDRKWFASV